MDGWNVHVSTLNEFIYTVSLVSVVVVVFVPKIGPKLTFYLYPMGVGLARLAPNSTLAAATTTAENMLEGRKKRNQNQITISNTYPL